jgi:hypothetical protein
MDIKTYILYDDRRSEYFPLIVDEMHRQKISKYIFVDPIPHDNVVKSISVSQKLIIQKAKDLGLKEVVIFEQDIWFPCETGWKYFIENKPEDYDIYLGGSYLIDNTIEYKAPLVKVNSYVGHHCIMVHEKYYDKFLETPEDKHIDTEQQGKGDFYLCYPMPALQRPGFSTNNKMIVDYNKILEKKDIYE